MLDRGDSMVLVDTRSPASFKLQRLPGAINIPNSPESPVTETWITSTLLGLPRDKLIVFYCDCPDDDTSASLADKLIKLDASYATYQNPVEGLLEMVRTRLSRSAIGEKRW